MPWFCQVFAANLAPKQMIARTFDARNPLGWNAAVNNEKKGANGWLVPFPNCHRIPKEEEEEETHMKKQSP